MWRFCLFLFLMAFRTYAAHFGVQFCGLGVVVVWLLGFTRSGSRNTQEKGITCQRLGRAWGVSLGFRAYAV